MLALEGLFPTDDALSTSVFTEKPNKPLEQQSQQRGLRRELGQAAAPSRLERGGGWTEPPGRGTGIGPSWRSGFLAWNNGSGALAVELWLWHKLQGLFG